MAVGTSSTLEGRYQANVGRTQGGDQFYAKSSGYFNFYNTAYTGQELRNFFRSQYTLTVVLNSAGVLSAMTTSTPILTPGYGMFHFNLATAASNASCRLPVPEAGDMIVLDGKTMAVSASCMFLASNTTLMGGSGLAGVTIVGSLGVNLSAFALQRRTLASGWPHIKLVCFTAGTWAVVESDWDEMCTEYPAA